jgi:hypothetical protein
MRNPDLKGLFLWCDGFVPERYFLDEVPMRATGSTWIGDVGSSSHEEWRFTLTLPPGTSSRTNLDWATLLPPPDVSGWLFVAAAKKELELRLG